MYYLQCRHHHYQQQQQQLAHFTALHTMKLCDRLFLSTDSFADDVEARLTSSAPPSAFHRAFFCHRQPRVGARKKTKDPSAGNDHDKDFNHRRNPYCMHSYPSSTLASLATAAERSYQAESCFDDDADEYHRGLVRSGNRQCRHAEDVVAVETATSRSRPLLNDDATCSCNGMLSKLMASGCDECRKVSRTDSIEWRRFGCFTSIVIAVFVVGLVVGVSQTTVGRGRQADDDEWRGDQRQRYKVYYVFASLAPTLANVDLIDRLSQKRSCAREKKIPIHSLA